MQAIGSAIGFTSVIFWSDYEDLDIQGLQEPKAKLPQ